MKAQIFSKKKLIALSAAAMAVAIPAAMFGGTHSFASASEENGIDPQITITVAAPTCLAIENYNSAIKLRYKGDSDSEHMHLGTNPNPSYGYITASGNTYDTIVTLSQDEGRAVSPYYWGQSFAKVNNTMYQSNINYFTNSYGETHHPVSGSITSGTLSASPTTLTFRSSYSTIYYTMVYAGTAMDYQLSVPSDASQHSITITVNGVAFTVIVSRDHLTVSTSRTISCNRLSSTNSSYGSFAYSGV